MEDHNTEQVTILDIINNFIVGLDIFNRRKLTEESEVEIRVYAYECIEGLRKLRAKKEDVEDVDELLQDHISKYELTESYERCSVLYDIQKHLRKQIK